MNLLPNQTKALTKQLPNKVGALFMEPGTGKTRVAIELVNAVSKVDLVVWIGPLRSIKPLDPSIPSIIDEINKWGGFNCENVVYYGIQSIQSSDRKWLELYHKVESSICPFIIIDESIKIKNDDAKRTKRMMELSKMAEYKLILNGEPVTRNLLDLWSQFNFLDPEILNMALPEFKDAFCNYTKITKFTRGYGRSYTKEFITSYANVDYLYSLIGEYVFECDLELNVKQLFQTDYFTLDEEALSNYNHLKEKYLDDEMMEFKNNNIFLEMTMKMQHEYCITEDKFIKVEYWFETYPEEKSIIFCKYISSQEECKKRFPKALVLNYKTGSESLNLQDRPYTVYFDNTFDWGDVIQSQHRNYRTGVVQDVRYLRLLGNVGLEELMRKNNEKKQSLSEYLKTISRKDLKDVL